MNNYVEPQPIQPYQAPIIPQAIERIPEKKKGRSKLFFYLILAVLILGSSLVIGYIVAYGTDNKTEDTNTETDNQTEDNPDDTVTKPDSYTTDTQDNTKDDIVEAVDGITVAVNSPEANDTVTGEIVIEGISNSNKKDLVVRVYDFNKNLLGEKGITNYIQVDDFYNWGTTIILSNEPSEKIGTIKVFEIVDLETETLLATNPIKFQILEDAEENHLRLLAPQANQLIKENDVLFLGEMANVFEATLNIRLTDELGNVLYSGPLTANGSGDIYSGEFVEFNQTVSSSELKQAKTSNGKWEVFEISAMDGSEILYVEIPVVFVMPSDE